mgnify:CR=1 FL=1
MTNPNRTALKGLFCFLILHFTIHAAPAQERVRAGLELDVLPYITGGYFGAIWAGKGHVRGRALFAKVNMPEFIVPDGFRNNTIRSYALVGDYFMKADQTGVWISGGFVLWDGKIQTDQELETASYRSFLINGSLGYALNLSPKFYLSPWAGLSLRVGGDQNIMADGQNYDPPFLNPELSLKLGYRF